MSEMGQGTKRKKYNINAYGRFSKPRNYFMEKTQHWGSELPWRRSALSECIITAFKSNILEVFGALTKVCPLRVLLIVFYYWYDLYI